MRAILEDHEPLFARTLSDSIIASWLQAGQTVARVIRTPPYAEPFEIPVEPEEPIVSFPIIEEAAKFLAEKTVLTRPMFDQLSDEAKKTAFTVARISSEDALAKIQTMLVEDVRTGGTLAEFREALNESLDTSALSPWHQENVYRTNIGQAQEEGKQRIANHPLVTSEFPYVAVSVTHDSRLRETHRWFYENGLNGTNIYRRDDHVIQKFWPATWDYSCRCGSILLSVKDAARRGVKEAIEWLRTGEPPASPEYVSHPPFEPPFSFRRMVTA